jgi:polysaccharide chain length determinant protein (PEP-CTERM system associated)
MSELLSQLTLNARRMWRKRWLGVGVAWVAALLGGAAVSMTKDRFEASARVYVDTQTVLKPLMAGLAFQPDIDQQVKMLARTLISRPNVERLMKSPEVGLERPPASEYDRALERLKDKIKIAPSGAGNLYSISYRDADPQRARRLVEGLVNMFMESSADTKKRDSAEASRFIDEQIKEYEGKLAESENKLKEFKLRNFGVSGVSNQDYFTRMSTLTDEVNKLKLELSAATQSRDAMRRELASEDPQLPPESIAQPLVPLPPTETESRLEALRRQQDEMMRRFTDQHPDVIALKRQVDLLEQQRRAEQEAKVRDASKGRGTAATNPVYQRLRVSLAEAEANVASLRTQLGVQQGRLDQVRALASRIPQVEAELAQLNRDYDVIRKNYDQLVGRREAASLGLKIDQSANLTDFRVVEPPQVSSAPVFPGKRVLAVLAFLAALGAGIGATYLASTLQPTLDGPKDLAEASGRPVLGSVALQMNHSMRSSAQRNMLAFGSVVGLFMLVNVGWLLWVALVAAKA